MTQKELLYFEDAIGHEDNIIKIINSMLSNLNDKNIKVFMQNELTKHETLKDNLINKLGEKANG